jgi:hypothetical protein
MSGRLLLDPTPGHEDAVEFIGWAGLYIVRVHVCVGWVWSPVKSSQVQSGQVRSSQVKSGQVKLGGRLLLGLVRGEEERRSTRRSRSRSRARTRTLMYMVRASAPMRR